MPCLVHLTPNSGVVKKHIGQSPVCLAAGLGVKEVELEKPTNAIVGGTGAAGPEQDLRHQLPGLFIYY